MSFTTSLVNILIVTIPTIAAVDSNCDYYQDVAMGQKYYIYNREYPKFYGPATSCRWIGETSPNAVIVVTCEDINLPPSTNCQQDRLVISTSGDSKFKDGHNYCGSGSMSTVSTGNRVAIGLIASWFSMGGRFLCTITAIQSNNTNEVSQGSKCDCGWRQQRRIVGGVDAGVNEFPLMAAMIHLLKRDLTCGASLIATRYALTAAHCVINESIKTFALLVGDHNLNSGTDTASAALFLLEDFIAHPDYNLTSRENDIAVVKTEKTIPFGGDVGPVCLPFRYSTSDFIGRTVIALGWGTIEFTGPRSEVLQKVDLTVIQNSKCQQELTNTKIFNSELCTYGEDKDACQFDSGGPILWYDSNTRRLQLIGVISYGIGCGGGFPSVNTRVTSYLAWIITVTSDADYCIK
ncbi:hypothetical protein RN001_001258 [Aquatica leii]|uniref:Venom serine protease 34 n=1 Tax=Aquatica leii TaxID=1421715 RepID=A0AAN7SJH8_9COLE|nr:hypothetical protein RN001_001258 [Aquatica leii]